MFENIGGKIKKLASILTYVGIAASCIIGIIIMCFAGYFGSICVLIGFLVMFVGSLLSWVSSFLLYGFGELVEDNEVMKKIMLKENPEIFPEHSIKHGETWRCPECCRDNSANTNECKCGYKRESKASGSVKPWDDNNGHIICPVCGKRQDKRLPNRFCAECGQEFAEDEIIPY